MTRKSDGVNNTEVIENEEIIETTEEVKIDDNKLYDELVEDAEQSLNELKTMVTDVHVKAKKSWKNGFLSGYSTAVGGVVLGIFAMKAINNIKNSR